MLVSVLTKDDGAGVMPHPIPLRFAKYFLCAVGLSALSANATVLSLNFDGGTGTSAVDQYTGAVGSGWSTAWTSTFHSGTTGGAATVASFDPLIAGGGNYLQLNYGTTNNTNLHVARATRQFDTSAISLTSPFTLSFNFRSLTDASTSTGQFFTLFGSSSSASGSSSNDSWKLYGDQTGWYTFNNNTQTSLGATGGVKANETWNFIITIDPVADTYSVTAQNLTTASSVFSVSGLALRNGADASLAFLNFNATGAQNVTGLGFAIDSISIASSIPEPTTAAACFGGVAVLFAAMVRRRTRL